MIATTTEALDELFTETICDIEPRIAYQGGERFKPYSREVSGASRTRRFSLRSRRSRIQPGGGGAGYIIEHVCDLRIRVDYVGDHAKLQHVIDDDHLLLRDVLSGLADDDNGLVMVTPTTYRESRGRGEDRDVLQIDHTYTVRYMRSIRP